MNKKTNNNVIPEDILELIPWFTIDKLSVDDHALFENALVTYPSLRQHLELEQQMCAIVSVDSSLLDKSAIASMGERLKTVFNIIDAEHSQQKSEIHGEPDSKNSLLERFKNTFDAIIASSNILPQYARVASVGLLVLSITLLANYVKPSLTDENYFTPASAVTESTNNQVLLTSSTKTTLLVGFNGTRIELENNDALKGKLITIEGTPENEGVFQISFEQAMNTDEIKQTVDALLAQEEKVWFAGESY